MTKLAADTSWDVTLRCKVCSHNSHKFHFFPQVMQIIEILPAERQTMMFSATIPPSIEKLSTALLQNPVLVSVGMPSAPTSSVKQLVLWVEDKAKKKCLFSLLQDSKHYKPPMVVFVDSKVGADLLAEAIATVTS